MPGRLVVVDPAIVGGFFQGARGGFVETALERVSGSVTVQLYKGVCQPVARTSPYSLYREDLATFGDDAVYTNIPIDPPNRGKEAIRKTIEGFLGMAQAIEFVVHHSAEDPRAGIVMNERTDRFRIGDKWVEARVMGVFELRGGKIAAWRDYFDLAEFQSQMSAS